MKRRDVSANAEAPAPHPTRLESGLRERTTIFVSATGRWFQLPGSAPVSVARWRPLQRLLARLAEHRDTAPGEPLTVDALVAAGWPGERMLPRAGATRVYTAIASLRRLGLRDLLLREGGGYLLAPGVPVERVDKGAIADETSADETSADEASPGEARAGETGAGEASLGEAGVDDALDETRLHET
jgi:hypothetical protein